MSIRAHVGIFGPGLCGKSTLASALVKSTYNKSGYRAIVLDMASTTEWGKSSIVCTDASKFWALVHKSRNCLIVFEEATSALKHFEERELVELFTRIRHRGHKLIIIAHRATALKPILREQLSHLYLFRQSEKALAFFAESHAEPRIMRAKDLKKYEFIEYRQFGASDGSHYVVKSKLNVK